jgi:prepilin-type N-terminal cleavage/methylation domain-containing protein/prepilin-type processing-associated H-X9-DG protein
MRLVKRRAFTLVELLVVITIIGMLMSMLLPAVQAAREAGRGNTCKNNLRNVAFAMKYYETRNSHYPAIYDYAWNTPRTNYYWRPLVYDLLTDLERADVYEAQNRDNLPSDGCPGVYLSILICPSDPQPIGEVGVYPTAYIYNAGTPACDCSHFEQNNGLIGRADTAHTPPITRSNNETFVSLHDGTGTTLMVAENLDASYWNDWDSHRLGFLWDDIPMSQWPDVKINARNKGTTGPTAVVQATNPPDSSGLGNPMFSKPTSNHPGIVNVAFADGHVRSLSENVGYHVYAQLCTPWGKMARDSSGGPIDQWGPLSSYMTEPLNEQDIK